LLAAYSVLCITTRAGAFTNLPFRGKVVSTLGGMWRAEPAPGDSDQRRSMGSGLCHFRHELDENPATELAGLPDMETLLRRSLATFDGHWFEPGLMDRVEL